MIEGGDKTVHTSVLLNEIVEALDLKKGDVFLDGTFGGGGHSFEVCSRYSGVKIIAIDEDKDTWKRGEKKFKQAGCDIHFFHGNFRDLRLALKKYDVKEVNGILLDLGLSSDQLDVSGRGFSFKRDEPLLMTFKAHPTDSDLTAGDIVNHWSQENLETIIRGYGEEKFAGRIAKAIVEKREHSPIKTTFDLVNIIENAVPAAYRRGKIHFATRTFQAIRMAVNDELNTLDLGLKEGFEVLSRGGKMAIISFHSLEDRIVKNFYRAKEKDGSAKLFQKKPIEASEEEILNNKRSRSAKLRILEKII